jgi:hypothetical protein
LGRFSLGDGGCADLLVALCRIGWELRLIREDLLDDLADEHAAGLP